MMTYHIIHCFQFAAAIWIYFSSDKTIILQVRAQEAAREHLRLRGATLLLLILLGGGGLLLFRSWLCVRWWSTWDCS